MKALLIGAPNYRDLLIACKFLFEYNIREAEQLRIQLGWINWEKGELTIPETVIERGRMVNGTKNGLMAKFQLRKDMLDLLAEYIGSFDDKSNFLFGGHYKPGATQRNKQFLSNRWWKFREDFQLSKNLKLYALKHTGNYESLETVGIEKLSKMARHSSISQTQDYVKSKLDKQLIVIDGKAEF
ncbi:tyrosine-type recombinase/integrase [Pedobacter sp. P26]|uniref:tyrosine-type recombinase/integrase n=1 Tax=Pedobacter sp. P26 TaxID=3423956 RepID=UPI003D6655D4